MAGKPYKATSALQDRTPSRLGRRASISLVPQPERVTPAPPRGLHATAKAAWCDYFASPISNAFDTHTDLPALRRWAWCLSERARFQDIIRKTPLVKGSVGQLRANPLTTVVNGLNAEIDKAEDKFGMNPQSRMRLGIEIGAAADVMADLMGFGGYAEPETVDLDALTGEGDFIEASGGAVGEGSRFEGHG